MNTQTQEALKMAIEAFVRWEDTYKADCTEVINACKEALEQPAQSSCEECIGFNKQLMAENDSLRNVIQQLENESKFFDEQPAQEPVEVYGILDDGDYVSVEATKESAIKQCDFMNKHDCNCTYKPLYTHPHQWQELTDDEIVAKVFENDDLLARILLLDVASKALKQALKEMNT